MPTKINRGPTYMSKIDTFNNDLQLISSRNKIYGNFLNYCALTKALIIPLLRIPCQVNINHPSALSPCLPCA